MGIFSFFKSKKPEEPESEKSPFADNLNYMLFAGNGVFSKTGRTRKIRIEAFSIEEAIESLISEGYEPQSIKIERIPFDPPTENQIAACKAHRTLIPKQACQVDVSFIMQKCMDGEKDPDPKLVQFATERKIKLSYYAGDISLYNCIWAQFDLSEKFSFYVLCVKKDKSGRWDFGKFDYYKKLSESVLNDEYFMNSFKRYLNSGFTGFIEERTSRNTNCYKVASTL